MEQPEADRHRFVFILNWLTELAEEASSSLTLPLSQSDVWTERSADQSSVWGLKGIIETSAVVAAKLTSTADTLFRVGGYCVREPCGWN